MSSLTQIEWLILNETKDDSENLEQLYRALAFEFSPIHYQSNVPDAYYWRESDPPILLADIADAVRSLVEKGLLSVRHAPSDAPATNDVSYVWRSWFQASPEGRAWCSAHEARFADTHLTRLKIV